ncbi:MAG: exosortase-associated EpsI family protein [Verrucomicrobiota bacterium]|nr:exosortase-associated EpsI family protein [Verrucomicrobiota bacterium]
MTPSRIKACGALSVLLLATFLSVRFGETPRLDARLPVAMALPDVLGGWTGENVWFCRNPACGARHVGAGDRQVCDRCGHALGALSAAERKILPQDTVIVRKEYRNVSDKRINVAIVLSGKERSSIHPPQWCLSGQGYSIKAQHVLPIRLADGRNLNVALLDVEPAADAGARNDGLAFAYWFVGGGHETSSRLARVAWMAFGSIFRGVHERWAYVSVMTARERDGEKHIHQLKEFIGCLHPAVVLPR